MADQANVDFEQFRESWLSSVQEGLRQTMTSARSFIVRARMSGWYGVMPKGR
jgi:hypothetical protein